MNLRFSVLALLVCGCAATPAGLRESAWTPDESWWAGARQSGGTVVTEDGSTRFVTALHATNLFEVSRGIQQHSAISAGFAFVDSDTPNAFATDSNGRRLITFSLGLLEAIGDDRDALATTIGHEMAHLHYAHGEARMGRYQPAQGITFDIGPSLGISGAQAGGAAGAIAVNASFSRYEEREADQKGMEWAVAAGFSPCGSARTIRLLKANGNAAGAPSFHSTHPDYEERIARANAMAKRLTGKAC